MTLTNYINLHTEEIKEIPVESIVLTEKIHNHGNLVKQPVENPVIIARPLNDNKYSLVLGWAEYIHAKESNMKKINCILTQDNRSKFIRKNLRGTEYINAIQIPQQFKNSPPRPEKVQQKIDYYKEHGQFKRKLRIDNTGKLYDGYATYLASQQLGLKVVPVDISKQTFQIHK